MRKIFLFILGIILVSGCTKEEKDLILGVWDIDYSYFIDGRDTYKHVDWNLTWIFQDGGFGFEDGLSFQYNIDPRKNTLFIQITNTNDKRAWDIIQLDRKVLHVAYLSDGGFYIHYIFNRTK